METGARKDRIGFWPGSVLAVVYIVLGSFGLVSSGITVALWASGEFAPHSTGAVAAIVGAPIGVLVLSVLALVTRSPGVVIDFQSKTVEHGDSTTPFSDIEAVDVRRHVSKTNSVEKSSWRPHVVLEQGDDFWFHDGRPSGHWEAARRLAREADVPLTYERALPVADWMSGNERDERNEKSNPVTDWESRDGRDDTPPSIADSESRDGETTDIDTVATPGSIETPSADRIEWPVSRTGEIIIGLVLFVGIWALAMGVVAYNDMALTTPNLLALGGAAAVLLSGAVFYAYSMDVFRTGTRTLSRDGRQIRFERDSETKTWTVDDVDFILPTRQQSPRGVWILGKQGAKRLVPNTGEVQQLAKYVAALHNGDGGERASDGG